MKIPKAPPWLLKREGLTQRQWKAQKRRQLKTIEAAICRYRFGCLYTPGYQVIETAAGVVSGLIQTHSVKAWGR